MNDKKNDSAISFRNWHNYLNKENIFNVIKWACFIFGLFCILFLILKYDNAESIIWFTYASGISFGVWLVMNFEGNKGEKIINILIRLLFFIIGVFLDFIFLFYSIQTLLTWPSSKFIILRAFGVLFVSCIGLYVIFSLIFVAFKKIFNKLKAAITLQFQGKATILKDITALLGSITAFASPIAAIITAVTTILKNIST